MRRKHLLTTFLANAVVVSALAPCAQAQTDRTASGAHEAESLVAIERLTNDIVRCEIGLMKKSTQFHVAWLKPNKWKPWRVFAYKMTGSCLTNAGMITIAASRFKYIDDPTKAPRPFLKAGHIINLTAASIVATSTVFEMGLDYLRDLKIAKDGMGLKKTLENYRSNLGALDALLVKRSQLVKDCPNLTAKQREILEVDGQVLNDIRDLTTAEFHKSYREIAGHHGARNMANATTLFGAGTAGYAGSLQSLLSVTDRIPQQTGVAGIGFMTSGASVVASPLLIHWSEQNSKNRASAKLEKLHVGANVGAAERFASDRKRLEHLIQTADPSEKELLVALGARSTVYTLHSTIFDSRHAIRQNERQRAHKDLKERMFFSTIVGGTQIARGAQLAVAGFEYPDDKQTLFKLAASASTAYIVGTGVWTLDNVQSKIREEATRRRLHKAKMSVHANLLTDLDTLDDMDNQMSIY